MQPLLDKKLPAKINNLAALSEPVLICAREQGVEENKVKKLDLALEEIIVNIIKYAYPRNAEPGDIRVVCGTANASGKPAFLVEVIDTGRPFDVTEEAPLPDIQANLDDRRIGGLGIFLVKKTMDLMTYRRSHNKNILTIGLFLHYHPGTSAGK